jgi:hypothetical protein
VLDDVERLKKGGIEESTRDEHGEFFPLNTRENGKLKETSHVTTTRALITTTGKKHEIFDPL